MIRSNIDQTIRHRKRKYDPIRTFYLWEGFVKFFEVQ